ncbi:MAG: IscA/HesB family protein [Desulfovibrio sp.]|jgi:Fe-S cluster assembly iron-binding protein IscA|nr:IscA/HesB family protein [Desulfovibrio sp.]
MFELTIPAREELDAYFTGKDKSPIRVFLSPGGCSGPRLALALDDAGETDTVFDAEGYSFCINSDLYSAAKNVKVDFSGMGFMVESELETDGGGCSSGCASCCGH